MKDNDDAAQAKLAAIKAHPTTTKLFATTNVILIGILFSLLLPSLLQPKPSLRATTSPCQALLKRFSFARILSGVEAYQASITFAQPWPNRRITFV